MLRHLPAVLLFAVACGAPSHHGSRLEQAAAVRPPAPAPGPLVRPTMPSYPGQTHAPAGAGASHGGLPTTKEAVPRSPNKRVLPATSEPGLWAADGAPRAGEPPPSIFGIPIPLPEHSLPDEVAVVGMCSYDSSAALRLTNMTHLLSYPEDVRRCMAARAYLACTMRYGRATPDDHRPGPPSVWQPREVRRRIQPKASALVEKWCKGVTMTPEQSHALRVVEERIAWRPKDLSLE